MLRNRLITVLTLNDGTLFRTKLFQPDYRYTLNFVDTWSIDEVTMLDITRTENPNQQPFIDAISNLARHCFVPLAAGGGIRNVDDARRLIDAGADKIIVNTGALEIPELISDIAKVFGSQSLILSIDAKRLGNDDYQVFSHFGQIPSRWRPWEWAKRGEELGAGEILITAIERDGSLEGYDLELTRRVANNVSLPVQALGGAGSWQHFVEGIQEGKASAVCTQNIYHFTERSIQSAKTYLGKKGVNVRL